MKSIAILGSRGKIGSVLTKGLAVRNNVVGFDLPDVDVSKLEELSHQIKGVDVLIHVAHSGDEKYSEGDTSDKLDPKNIQMELNALDAAILMDVQRVILASSVHADDFLNYSGSELMETPGSYTPTGPYGAHKILIEEVGRHYASLHDIEVVAARFGGVTRDNSVETYGKEPLVWLSHVDLVAAIEAIVEASSVPANFCIMNVVSNNKGRIHSVKNPFGWLPKEDSSRSDI